MKFRNRLGLVLAVALVAIVGSRLVAEPKDEKPKADNADKQSYKPVLNVEQTMEGQGSLMKSIKAGILDGNWNDATKSALILAELSNTNQFHNDAADYQKWAKDLSKNCLELAKALHKRDENESKRLMSEANDTCQACHKVYKKKEW